MFSIHGACIIVIGILRIRCIGVLCRDTGCVNMFNVSDFNLTLICLNSISFWAPFEGTSAGARAKNIEAVVYCSLMQEHAMCDVDSLSIAPPRLLLLPTLTSLLLSQT